ncbi:LysE family translocator [Paraneptunicella aestuarii]|uniref:LysE family translocator n=1 Tax=Paraneptunicella aestuarii TaxID=2831148 RepID=UPI001E521284|nr:LysE family translocator [Paraneptunicella aestuarii]UAA38949.1 LysE family translocator [Paraneptunicella aestuarii]
MSFELWVTFTLATLVILMIPGPTIILVVSKAMQNGYRSVMPLVAGVVLGDFVAMTLSLLGLGAIMATSATLFLVFKWLGALYLLYLGYKLWKTPIEVNPDVVSKNNESSFKLFQHSFWVTMLNPKSIAFFVAFLPQFIQPEHPAITQVIVLGGTFLALSIVSAGLYGLFAGKLATKIKRAGVRRWFNRIGASSLIGAGVLTATMQRTA